MKLYYSPGACSLSPHIALHEAGLPHQLVKVDLKAKTTENGDDFTSINPKGQVPALMLDNGELLTEGPVIVQAIADKAAGKNLAPAAGSPERYRLQEWLNFITTELHKNFSPLFQPAIPDEVKNFFKDRIRGKFKYADSKLAGQDYLMGKQFTVADGRRLSVRDAEMGRAHRHGFVRVQESDGVQGPRRGAAECAGRDEDGRPAEGRVSLLRTTSKGPDR